MLGRGSSWKNPTPAPHTHCSAAMQPCTHPGQCMVWSSALLSLLALAEGRGFGIPSGVEKTLTHLALCSLGLAWVCSLIVDPFVPREASLVRL